MIRPQFRLRPEILALVVAVSSTFLPQGAMAQRVDVIPPSGKWVTDSADMLGASEESLLSARLAAFADSTSNQIIIVTVPDLGGAAPVDYAVELGRLWKVGQGGRNNGIVILVSRDDRQVFIAPGYGLEGAVTDAMASTVVQRVILPRFKEGRFYEGLSDAVDRLMLATAGEYDALADEPNGIPPQFIMLLFVILVIVLIAASNAKKGHGGGGGRYHGSGPVIWGGGFGGGFGGGSSGGFSSGGFGGFSGGGGSFGGGGAGGGW